MYAIATEIGYNKMSKQEECNRCKNAGHPNQIIGFKKSNKISENGKVLWDLVNQDGSDHMHKQAGTLPKAPQNGNPVMIDATSLDTTSIVKSIETLTQSVNALVFALCAQTELQKVQARAMVSK